MDKLVYFFANGQAEGSAKMKDLLGGKGANLAEMTSIGIPVPPGFTISTKACNLYFERRVISAMHAAGHRAASAWLAAGPRVDRLLEPGADPDTASAVSA